MLNLFRKFLRPSLREQLEDGVREALRRYAGRHTAPNLRVYVSTDLIAEGGDPGMWARDEGEHLRRFALQWAEDNDVPRVGLRVEVVLLDTKREFAFVKTLGLEPAEAEPAAAAATAAGQAGAAPAGVRPPPARGAGGAVLEVVEGSGLQGPLRVAGELILGRKAEEDGVLGTGDRYMSARHARFHLAGSRLWVTDLDSKNRTFLNDRPLPPHQQVAVAEGDLVRMGATTLRVTTIGG
jgi:hypothetical protein